MGSATAVVLTFLMLRTFNIVFHVVVTPPPTIKSIWLLLSNCNFATVMNHIVNIFGGLPKWCSLRL
jgi:hypothetical protein